MERCSALYAEVQRSVGRLARVCERRKAQLEKHLPSPPPAANKEDDVDDDGVINGNSLSTCRQVRQHIQSSTDAVNAPSKMFIGLFFFKMGIGPYNGFLLLVRPDLFGTNWSPRCSCWTKVRQDPVRRDEYS